MADPMDELLTYMQLMAKQEREWTDDWHDAKLFSAHTTPSSGIILKPLDLPDFMWRVMDDSWEVMLQALPEALRVEGDLVRANLGPSFFAWVLRIEARMRVVHEDDLDRELDRYAANYKNAPDAIEVRQWSGVSADGVFALTMTVRETGEVESGGVTRPGSKRYRETRSAVSNSLLLRAARVTEWQLGRWPRKK